MLVMAAPTDRSEIVQNALAEAAQEEARQTWRRLRAQDALRRWYLVLIQPHHEHVVSGHLTGLGIKVYSPKMWENRPIFSRNYLRGGRYQSGTKRVLVQMFPGYVFTRIDLEAEWPKVRSRAGVDRVKTLDRDGRPFAIADDLVAAIHEKEQSLLEGKKTAKLHDFKAGDKARVISGAFASFLGEIERLDSRTRIRILLDVFGRPTPVELEAHEIEAVDR